MEDKIIVKISYEERGEVVNNPPKPNPMDIIPSSKDGISKECLFFHDQKLEEADYWFIICDVKDVEECRVPKDNVVLVAFEPRTIRRWNNKKYLEQFNSIMSCYKHKDIKNITSSPNYEWFVKKSYNDIKGIDYSQLKKDKTLSIFSSNKKFNKIHKNRIKFCEYIKQELQDEIDWYGRGFNEIDDKWDGVAPYKYTVVIENSTDEHFWTEKIADAFLGNSYPFYFGSKNIYDYFPQGSLTLIDINKPKEAVKIIKEAISNNVFEKSQTALEEARNLVIDDYNYYNKFYKFIAQNSSNKAKEKVVINNMKSFKKKKNGLRVLLKNKIKNLFK